MDYNDILDGCDHVADAPDEELDDEETQSLRPLFPDGDPSAGAEWRELFDA